MKSHKDLSFRNFCSIITFSLLAISCTNKAQNTKSEPKLEEVVTILSTDLSIDRDPDDWFDLFLFLKLEKLNPAGIILDHYATEEVEDTTRKFLRLLGNESISVKKGVQRKLTFSDKGTLVASQFHDGADFILKTMKIHFLK